MRINTITLLDAVDFTGTGDTVDLASLLGTIKDIPSYDVTITGVGEVQLQTSKDGVAWVSPGEWTEAESMLIP